jgi:UDP-N-acetylglucosamine acyltransferase
MPVHPTAIVDPQATLGEGNDIGPFSIIGPHVQLGAGNRIGAHTVIDGPARIGSGNRIGHHCSLGAAPQDLAYNGEPTQLVVGDGNFFGDYVQLTRGTTKTPHRTTTIGNNNFMMAYCHVGHDCIVGNHVIAANGLQLAGHVTVEDRAVFGGLVAIHQYARVGTLAMISGGSVSSLDIPPYVRAGGYGCAVFGLNVIGLERNGVAEDQIKQLRKAYKVLFRSGTPYEEALHQLETEFPGNAQVQHWIEFFRGTQRGVVRERENK